MISGYDVFISVQLFLIMVFLIVAFRFRKSHQFNILIGLSIPILYVFWGGSLVYYFSTFPYLTVLWALFGFCIGGGISVYGRHCFPELCYYSDRHTVACLGAKIVVCFCLASVAAACGLQLLVYYFPAIVYYWSFNEMLGVIVGAFMGMFCAGVGVMLIRFRWVGEDYES